MKTYIASPFFTKSQRDVVENIRKQIVDLGIQVYSPMHDGILLTKDSGKRAFKNAYLGDIGGVRDADFVLAVMDYDDINFSGELYTKSPCEKYTTSSEISNYENRKFFGFDSGTIFEVGVAKGMGIPIIYYIPPNVKLNVMLAMAGIGHTTDIELVGKLVDDLMIKRKSFDEKYFVKEESYEDKGIK